MKSIIAILGLFIALSLTGCGDPATSTTQIDSKELSNMYKTGTVTVTHGSKDVTGVGMVAAGNFSIGDAFTTGDKWYTIESIASDGAWALTVPYTGPSAAGVPFAMVKRSSMPVDSTYTGAFQAQLAALQVLVAATAPYNSGTFTASLTTGFVTPVNRTAHWSKIGNFVTISLPNPFTGQSNAGGDAFYMWGSIPAELLPIKILAVPTVVFDNGVGYPGFAAVHSSGMTFYKADKTNFTVSGVKGLAGGIQISYSLD
jgi:hypothetical protein